MQYHALSLVECLRTRQVGKAVTTDYVAVQSSMIRRPGQFGSPLEERFSYVLQRQPGIYSIMHTAYDPPLMLYSPGQHDMSIMRTQGMYMHVQCMCH